MGGFKLAALASVLAPVALLLAPNALAQGQQGGPADADSTSGGSSYGSGSYGGGSSGTSAPRGPSGGTSPGAPTGSQTPTQDRSGSTTGRSADRTNEGYSNRRDASPWEQRSLQRPVYLSGRVLTDGGEPPPDRVVVKMNCGGGARPQAYTDSKGRFNFQPNSDHTLLAIDASVSTGLRAHAPRTGSFGRMSLFHCHLIAELPGYRSDRLPMRSASSLDRNDVGTIVLHRLKGFEGHTVSLTTLSAPRKAKKAYERGTRMLRRMSPNYGKSAAHFESAVEAYPMFADAWAALGEARLGLEDLEGAKEALIRSVEADPKLLAPYAPLMQMALQHGEWAALDSLSERYLKLSPSSAYARYLSAAAAANLGNLSRAESLVLKMRGQGEADKLPQTHLVMAMVHQGRVEFEKAAKEYEAYIGVASDPNAVATVKRVLFDWEALQIIEPRNEVLAGSP